MIFYCVFKKKFHCFKSHARTLTSKTFPFSFFFAFGGCINKNKIDLPCCKAENEGFTANDEIHENICWNINFVCFSITRKFCLPHTSSWKILRINIPYELPFCYLFSFRHRKEIPLVFAKYLLIYLLLRMNSVGKNEKAPNFTLNLKNWVMSFPAPKWLRSWWKRKRSHIDCEFLSPDIIIR